MKANAADARYQKLTASNGSPYHALTAMNGLRNRGQRVVTSTTARDNGITWGRPMPHLER